MKATEKKMMMALIILLIGLSAKSFLMDPYRAESELTADYAEFAKMMAPFKQQTMLDRMKVLTYRTVKVEQVHEGGDTYIVALDPDADEMIDKQLPGSYEARVRAYLLWVIPLRDVQIEGGFPAYENESGN